MPVIVCSGCQARIKAPDAAAGRTVACPRCRASVTVPAPANPVPGPGFDLVAEENSPTPIPTTSAQTHATHPCPFCAEPVRIEAKRCKHCGETLDAAMRATEETRRAAERTPLGTPSRRARREEADDQPRSHRSASTLGCGGCLGVLVGVPLLLICVAVVVMLGLTWYQRETLNQATRLYDAGQRDEAVSKYKSAFAFAGDEQAAVLKRIVAHELSRGDTTEATKWIERGIASKIEVVYDDDAANVIRSRLVTARADPQSKDKGAADERAEARKRDEEAKAKSRPKEDPAKARVKANRSLPRDDVRSLILGRSGDEVIRMIGSPDQTSDIEGVGSNWTYLGVGLHVNTGRMSNIALIEFDGAGLVSGVSFS